MAWFAAAAGALSARWKSFIEPPQYVPYSDPRLLLEPTGIKIDRVTYSRMKELLWKGVRLQYPVPFRHMEEMVDVNHDDACEAIVTERHWVEWFTMEDKAIWEELLQKPDEELVETFSLLKKSSETETGPAWWQRKPRGG